MKKFISYYLIISLVFLSWAIKAQNCGTILDRKSSYYDSIGLDRSIRLMDRFGNEYLPQDISVQEVYDRLAALYPAPLAGDSTAYTPFVPSYTCNAGLFKVHFAGDTAGFGFHIPKNREIICQIFKDISRLIFDVNPANPNRVNIWVASDATYAKVRPNSSTSSSSLAFASPYIVSPSLSTDFFSESIVARNIRLGYDNGDDYPKKMLGDDFMHGNLVIRFSAHTFDTAYRSTSIAGNTYDLYTVALHEVLHLMGVYSSTSPNGSSVFGNNVYSLMDQFLTFGSDSSKRLLKIDSNFNIKYSNTYANTDRGCSDTATIKFYGRNLKNKQMYSPASYSPGSFLSHVGCTNGTSCASFANNLSSDVMNYCVDKGSSFIKRKPSTDEVKLLCDLGFELNSKNGIIAYGADSTNTTVYNTYTSPCHTSSPNCNIIAGVDTFDMKEGVDSIVILKSKLMSNDRNTSFIKNFKSNSSNGAIIKQYKDSIVIYYEAARNNEYIMFSYIPICSDTTIFGTKTFVYIKASLSTKPICEPSNDCNLVCKGDFEGNIPNFRRLNYCEKFQYHGQLVHNSTTEFIYKSSVSPFHCIADNGNPLDNPTCFFTGYIDKNPPNSGNRFARLSNYKTTNGYKIEFLNLFLKKPILPNKKYILTFKARRLSTHFIAMDMPFMLVGDSVKPCLNEVTYLDGTVSSCGFKAKRIDGKRFILKKADTTWKTFSDTLLVSDIKLNHLMFLGDTFIRSSNLVNGTGEEASHILCDDIEIREIAAQPLNLLTIPSNTSPCINNQVHKITYKICADSADYIDTLRLSLNIPAEFTVMSYSDFKPSLILKIPNDSLKKGMCLERTLYYQLNPNLTLPDAELKVFLNLMNTSSCFSTTEQTTTTIRPLASPLSLIKSSNRQSASVNDTIIYTITVCNTSTDSFSNVQLRDTIRPEIVVFDKGNFNYTNNVIQRSYNIGKAYSIVNPRCISESYKAILENLCPFQNCAYLNHTAIQCINLKSCASMNLDKKDSITIVPSRPRLCHGDTLALRIGNWKFGGDFSWWSRNGALIKVTSDTFLDITLGGTYHLKYERNFGCTMYDSIHIRVDTPPSIMKTITSASCLNLNGAINLMVSGGKSPYTYIWNNGSTSKDRTALSAGEYIVKVTDSLNCSRRDTINLTKKTSSIELNKTLITPPCARGTGSISLNPFNGTAPYTYIWAASAHTTNTRTNLAQGTYLVTITDNNGCFRRDTSLIKSLNSPLAISVTTHSYNCATNTISLQASVSGGVPFSYPYYQLLWSNGATNANPSNVSVVNYPNMKLVVTDAVGCKDSVIAPTNNWINIGTGTMYPNATSFTNTSVLTGKVRLYGTFTVNKQFSFVDAEIAANTASKIVVNKTSQNKPISLSSKNSRFYSCTDKLWKGIEIGDSCHIAMTNSTIEDALYGLELKNRAKKEINSNTFKNNFIAIFQTPTTSNHIIQSSDYDRDIWFNDIINNTFTGKGTGYIKPAPAGIALHGSHSAQHPLIYTHAQAWAALELNNAPYVDYFYNNKINQMANGVLTNNCHRVNLSGSNFSQIYPTNFPYPQSPLYQGICIFNMDLGNKPSRINNTSLPPTISSLDVNGYIASSSTNGVTTIGSATRFFDSHWGIFSFKGDIIARKLSFQNMNSIMGALNVNQVIVTENTASNCKSGMSLHQNTSWDTRIDNNVLHITGFDTSSGALDIVRTAGINKLWFTASSISKNNINLLNTTGFGIRTHNYQRVNNNLNGTIENKVQDNYINLARPDKAIAGIQYNNSHIAEVRNEVNSSFPNSRAIINNMRKPIGTYPVGIHYNETQGAFSCNKTYNLRTGMLYSLNCKNARMSKCKFFNNTTGLKLDNTSSVRSDTSNGNTWLGAWTGTGIRAAENLQSPINTWFLVRVTAPSIFWPSPRFPSSFFRNNPRTGSENDFCLNGGSGIGIGQEWYAQATPVSFLDLSINQQIIDGSLSYDVYDPELVYQGEQMLLEELYNIEDLLADSSDAHDFLIAHDTTNMGRFLRIKKDERDAFEPTASEKTSAQGLKAAIDLVQTRRWELDSILYTLHDTTPPPIITDTAYEPDTTLAAPNGYVLEYQVLTYSLDSLQYHMFLLDSAINTRAFPIMDTLWVRNAAIEPANTTETLQKLFNSVHYKTHAKRIGDLSPEQLATYRYLAQQCPALNADVVYKSRAAILPYDGNIDYQDYDTCFSVGIEYKSTKQPRNVAQKEIKKPNIQLYPNPAKESIFVRFSVIPETEISILVTDIQGKIVYKEPIMLNSNIISIQTSDWIEGVYIISIREGKNNLMESKFTIEK